MKFLNLLEARYSKHQMKQNGFSCNNKNYFISI